MSDHSDGDKTSDMEIITSYENNHKDLEVNNLQDKESSESTRRSAAKRKEMDDGNSDERNDDEFITVNRRRAKRLITRESGELARNMRVDEEKNVFSRDSVDYEVCVTSVDVLPKQIAMAKLLRSENITGIIRIKYKSSFKVLIQFKDKESAVKLLECQEIKEKGLRCQLTQDLTMTYGLVRGVDLDLREEELTKIFESSAEILSVKRLKRLNSDGKWVESESIRVCFKSNSIPLFIYAYDCRFKVEPYVFPVTQCNGCWQFGHFLKYCPIKKIICPKCGADHVNCNIQNYKCLNCKGDHFVLDKNCPFFVKEKSIRSIMSKEQVTYRRALQLFYENKPKEKVTREHSKEHAVSSHYQSSYQQNYQESYRDKLVMGLQRQDAVADDQNIEEESEKSSGEMSAIFQAPKSKRRNSKKKRKSHDSNKREMGTISEKSQNEEEIGERDGESRYKFVFKKFWFKIKNIILSEGTFEEKINSALKIISGELNKFLTNMLLHGRLIERLIKFVNG